MYQLSKTNLGILALGLTLWSCGNPKTESKSAALNSGVAPVLLPQDVNPSCTLSPDTFKSWFASGNVTENGLVTPANSVAFPHNDNCDFYQWAEHMFLWITSPSSGSYSQGGIVLESNVFYSVSPVNDSNQRILIPHISGTPLRMTNHLVKNGPNHLPVIRDKAGRLFEIETPTQKPNLKAMVKSAAGGQVEVDHVEAVNGQVVFMNKAGKPIEHPKAIIQHKLNQQNIVQRFALGNKFVFLDGAGNIIESEEGQATGDALMSKHGALVYYLSFVNDVYAWYLTGAKDGSIDSTTFPTTAGARDSICAYARAHGATLPDSNALALELKTSWVEASTLPDPENYVCVNAVIPVYDTSNANQWVPTGERTAKMAMVGAHIVGSVAGHPEMIWATFEHDNNSPNAAYQYVDSSNTVKTVPQDTGSHWLFSTNASDTAPNVSHITTSGDTLLANNGFPISPSNVLRTMPWGSAMDSVTNQQDSSSAASNSEIISINNTILGLLVGNDLRRHYLLIGATWTFGGAAPNGTPYGSDTTPGVSIGTNVLANSTMETYFQSASYSCFYCHHGGTPPSLNPGKLSHVFEKIQPLITAHNAQQKQPKGKK